VVREANTLTGNYLDTSGVTTERVVLDAHLTPFDADGQPLASAMTSDATMTTTNRESAMKKMSASADESYQTTVCMNRTADCSENEVCVTVLRSSGALFAHKSSTGLRNFSCSHHFLDVSLPEFRMFLHGFFLLFRV